jgi:hypothetical protein
MISAGNTYTTTSEPSFKLEAMMMLFCVAGVLLFVGGIVVGQQLTMATWAHEEAPAAAVITGRMAHCRFGVPRLQAENGQERVPDLIGLDHTATAISSASIAY